MRFGSLCFVGALALGLVAAAPASAADSDSTLTWRLEQLSGPGLRSATHAEQGAALSLLSRGPGSLLRDHGRVVVEIRVGGRTAKRVAGVRTAGARVLDTSARYRTITAAVDEADLPAAGAAPGVESVVEQITPMTGSAGAEAAPGAINTCQTGVVSEGDQQLRAREARTQFDVDGSGIKVGILSDSFDTKPTGISASDDVSTGDLPGPGNPCGRNTPVQVIADNAGAQADEGRAMLQIVHDLAPGASLAFATAFTGETQFGNNIRALATAGARVIADDIIYFREPIYQDGVIAKAINDVSAQGVGYYTMAYNSNRIVAGNNVNSWEAPAYRPTACPAAIPAGGDCMDFNPAAGAGNVDPTFGLGMSNNAIIRLTLDWAQPQFGVTNDFDVYLLNGAGALTGVESVEDNLTTERPNEFLGFSIGGGSFNGQLVIHRVSGAATPRLKWINSDNAAAGFNSTEYTSANSTDTFGPTIYGHNGAAAAQTIGAVPYNNSNTVENFSARGPVTHLFGPVNGTTPASPISENLSKPNVSATDGGITTFFGGGNRFFGTSASAPHAAAVAALQMEANPTLNQTQVKARQRSTAVAVGAFGPNEVGAGLIDAFAAIGSAPPSPPTVSGLSGPALTSTTSPTFSFTTTGDLKTLSCQVDGGAAVPCGSPFTTAAVADGSHTLAVTATDYFAQTASQSVSFEVDSTAPALKLKKKPKKKTSKRKAKFKFETEPGVGLTCKLDRKQPKECGPQAKFKVGPGKHKLVVTATDAAGNTAEESYRWKVRK